MHKILFFSFSKEHFQFDFEINLIEANLLQMQRKNISQESLLNSSRKIKYFKKHFVLTF